MANSTEEGNRNTLETLACVTPSTGLYQQIILVGLNILLSITAILGNALVVLALHKESSLHPPSKLMFRCLAITDLGVGVVSQPLFAAKLMLVFNGQQTLCYHLTISAYTLSIVFSGVSLLTVTLIGIDRLLALSLGLRYRQVVTLRRVRAVTSCFWFLSVTLALMQRFWNHLILARVISAAISLCLVTSVFCYLRIFYVLRHQQAQVQNQFQRQGQQNDLAVGSPLNIMLYRKTVSTGIWVQVTLVACYLPESLVFPLVYAGQISLIPVGKYTLTVMYLNSTLNPIVYCWKIKPLREALKNIMKQFCTLR